MPKGGGLRNCVLAYTFFVVFDLTFGLLGKRLFILMWVTVGEDFCAVFSL